MTRRKIPLGRWVGVPVTVGPSWLLVIPLVGVALFAGIAPRFGPLWGRVLVSAVGTLLLFASVLVHELGHAVAARRRGIVVERVVVFLFGGYSEMDLDDVDPADDIAVSAAGPIASAILAMGTLAVAIPAPEWAGTRRTLALLGLVNAGVALFNLLPGFPLDGGRIVRAGLVEVGFERRAAEVVTARIGMGLGAAAVVAGVWMSIRGDAGAVVAVPVGLLVLVIAAAAHPRRLERAGDVMTPSDATVVETDPMTVLASLPGSGPVPVVAAGRVVGFVSRRAGGLLVGEAMVPVGPLDVVDVREPAARVRDRIAALGRPVAVVDRGRLVGVVAPAAESAPVPSNEKI